MSRCVWRGQRRDLQGRHAIERFRRRRDSTQASMSTVSGDHDEYSTNGWNRSARDRTGPGCRRHERLGLVGRPVEQLLHGALHRHYGVVYRWRDRSCGRRSVPGSVRSSYVFKISSRRFPVLGSGSGEGDDSQKMSPADPNLRFFIMAPTAVPHPGGTTDPA